MSHRGDESEDFALSDEPAKLALPVEHGHAVHAGKGEGFQDLLEGCFGVNRMEVICFGVVWKKGKAVRAREREGEKRGGG